MRKSFLIFSLCLFLSGLYGSAQEIRMESMVRESPSEYGLVRMYRPSQSYQPQISRAAREAMRELPTAFDWRDKEGINYVSPVKHQGPLGTCYAFASVGEFESLVRIHEQSTDIYSENNIKGGSGQGEGGWSYVNTWYLSLQGYVLEEDDPYDTTDPYSYNPNAPLQKKVLGWVSLNTDYYPDTSLIKQFIQNNGPVWTSVSVNEEFNDYDGTYTMDYETTEDVDHGVLIVGWDDSLGEGAWIVKNSWGSNWGDDGFFYMAYNSGKIGYYSSSQVSWEDFDPYLEFYHYDTRPPYNYLGYDLTEAWQRVTFTPEQDRFLEKIGFWTNDAAEISIYIYDASENLIASRTNLVYEYEGYYTVPFTEDNISLPEGEEVKVVIQHNNVSYRYPISITDGAEYANKFEMSHNGNYWMAYDLGNENPDLRFGDSGVRLILRKTPDTQTWADTWDKY